MLRWFDHGDARLPWLEVGDPDGPPMVALPGLTDGLTPLSEPGTRQAVADLPTGELPVRLLLLSHRHPAPRTVTTELLAADVAAFVDAVVGAPVAVTGHSMGGMVAQHLAADRPDLVTHLALTATLARPDDAFLARIDRWETLVARHRWRAFYADALAASYTGSDLLRRRVVLRTTRASAVPHLVDRHRALTHACRRHDSTARLGDIRCPTLVMGGSRDPIVRPARTRELAAAIAGARLQILDGYAHGFPEQAPRRTYEAIVGLLEGAPGTADPTDQEEAAT